MPTVLRLKGFRFMIYQGDAEHGPAHVHAMKAGGEVVIYLLPVEVREVYDMNRQTIREAVRIVEEHQTQLVAAWRKLNG